MADEDTGTGPDEKTVKAAKEMGWTPQDQFKGDPAKWVDADEFVNRGEQLLPLLRKTNSRLKAELAERDAKIDNLTTEVQNANTAIERLDSHYSEANKRAATQAITNLKDQLKQAREDDDTDKEIELLEQIGLAQSEVRRLTEEAEKKTEAKDKKPDKPNGNKGNKDDPPVDPELKDWQKENEWFGTDAKRTRQFNMLAADLREELSAAGDDDKYSPVEFLQETQRLWEEQFGDGQRPDKTGSGNRSARGGNANGVKGWNQLPKEAKDACLADADYLVGEGKRFKDLAAWQAEYARIYHAS